MPVAESLKSRRGPRAFLAFASWAVARGLRGLFLRIQPAFPCSFPTRSQATSADAKTVDRPRAGTAVTCGLCSQPLGEQQPYAPAKMPGNVGAHEKASMVNVPYRNPSSAGISKAPRDRLPGLPLTRRPVVRI